MFRRRCSSCRTGSTTCRDSLGGRHEFKGGFDNGYTPEDVDTLRVDDVNLTFAQPADAARARSVQIFNTPLHQERAVMSTGALRAGRVYRSAA